MDLHEIKGNAAHIGEPILQQNKNDATARMNGSSRKRALENIIESMCEVT